MPRPDTKKQRLAAALNLRAEIEAEKARTLAATAAVVALDGLPKRDFAVQMCTWYAARVEGVTVTACSEDPSRDKACGGRVLPAPEAEAKAQLQEVAARLGWPGPTVAGRVGASLILSALWVFFLEERSHWRDEALDHARALALRESDRRRRRQQGGAPGGQPPAGRLRGPRPAPAAPPGGRRPAAAPPPPRHLRSRWPGVDWEKKLAAGRRHLAALVGGEAVVNQFQGLRVVCLGAGQLGDAIGALLAGPEPDGTRRALLRAMRKGVDFENVPTLNKVVAVCDLKSATAKVSRSAASGAEPD